MLFAALKTIFHVCKNIFLRDILIFLYLSELSQTLCTAEFFAAIFHLEHHRCVAVGATVHTNQQVVHVAEAQKTGVTAELVDDVQMYDFMSALQEDKQKTVCDPLFT